MNGWSKWWADDFFTCVTNKKWTEFISSHVQWSAHWPCFRSEHHSGQVEVDPQWETAGQGLVQSELLPWEQAFYPGAPETVFALQKQEEEGEWAFC